METKTTSQTLTNDLRQTLKVLMHKELESLIENLDKLEPKERMNVVCKLMPFVFPKVDTVSLREGEPTQFDNW